MPSRIEITIAAVDTGLEAYFSQLVGYPLLHDILAAWFETRSGAALEA